jgi:hypothetical protein
MKGITMHTLDEIILSAHQVVGKLLRTEVTVFDVETALQACCPDWPEDETAAVLRLAVEFAQTTGYTVFVAMDDTYETNMAVMEHHCYIAYELGDHLNLLVDFVWSDEDRERSILHRHVLYPLPPNF